MFDVVTDIPKTTEIDMIVDGVTDLIIDMTRGQVPHANPTAMIGAPLKGQLAQPAQLVAMGQGLAYLQRVAPTGCEGMQHDHF